jgi:hypothetical protein
MSHSQPASTVRTLKCHIANHHGEANQFPNTESGIFESRRSQGSYLHNDHHDNLKNPPGKLQWQGYSMLHLQI